MKIMKKVVEHYCSAMRKAKWHIRLAATAATAVIGVLAAVWTGFYLDNFIQMHPVLLGVMMFTGINVSINAPSLAKLGKNLKRLCTEDVAETQPSQQQAAAGSNGAETMNSVAKEFEAEINSDNSQIDESELNDF